jgi:uncharacterized membrane protein YvlD (DUF360 family)
MIDLNKILLVAVWFCAASVVARRFRTRGGPISLGSWIIIAGIPLTFVVCWFGLDEASDHHAIYWGRLMGGPAGEVYAPAVGSCIVGTCMVLVGWCWDGFRQNAWKYRFIPALVAPVVIWIVIYVHPTPHYVPMKDWQDKVVWALIFSAVIVIAALVPRFISPLTRLTLPLFWLGCFLVMITGIPCVLASHVWADANVDLKPLAPRERIHSMGCLACHTVAEGSGATLGRPEPGGPLEAACRHQRSKLLEFLRDPRKVTAERLDIRRPASNAMAGVHLTEPQAELLIDAISAICPKPLTNDIPMPETVKNAFEEWSCLTCHSLAGRGATQGVGGPLDKAGALGAKVLEDWLRNPTARNAELLGIRKKGSNQMSAIILSDEQRHAVIEYLISLHPPTLPAEGAAAQPAPPAKAPAPTKDKPAAPTTKAGTMPKGSGTK